MGISVCKTISADANKSSLKEYLTQKIQNVCPWSQHHRRSAIYNKCNETRWISSYSTSRAQLAISNQQPISFDFDDVLILWQRTLCSILCCQTSTSQEVRMSSMIQSEIHRSI